MSLEMTWYRVHCDWCRRMVDMQGSKPDLPFSWVEDDRKGIQFMEGAHFCGQRCRDAFRAADKIAARMARDAATAISRSASTIFDLNDEDFKVTIHHRGVLVQAGQ